MAVRKLQLQTLAPFLEGDKPTHQNDDGTWEWHCHCPLHEDQKRSASVNVDKGLFYCQACGQGMPLTELLLMQDEWVSTNGHANGKVLHLNGGVAKPTRTLSAGMIDGWHSQLLSTPSALAWLEEERGLRLETIQEYKIGMDGRVYTIPVYGPDDEILNVRYYNPHPGQDQRKIWQERGYEAKTLYPIKIMQQVGDSGFVIICEGEWDALLTIQRGFPAITRTGAADVWLAEWGQHFRGKKVYVCHDRDNKGQAADAKVAKALRHIADVYKIQLPYGVTEKGGKDLTDYWLEHTSDHFRELLARAIPAANSSGRSTGSGGSSDSADRPSQELATVEQANDANNVGKPLELILTIKGRKEPGYTIPKKIQLSCSQDAGNKCSVCPMRAANGRAAIEIMKDDQTVLALMDSTNSQVFGIIAETYGVPGGKCVKLEQDIQEYQAVELLFARPALDHSDGSISDPGAAAYKTLKITSVGRHNTSASQTVRVRGALQPNPRTQGNEFLAHEVTPMDTSIDRFELTDRNQELMSRFESNEPLNKLAEISQQLSQHVTRIVGRPQMHAVMDLTFHSVLSFNFAGERVDRGWLESLIVGDTRTGKSLAAQRLVQHFGAGEIISCEAASFAGVVGGLQTIGGKDWIVTWGVVPLNDRRLVVLDEVGGLSYEEIGQMSDVRSSGQAKLTKIQQETTWARTRLLWLGNPRNADMSHYTYGVDAIKPLIGNMEDIARFDLAMTVGMHDVASEIINQPARGGDLLYTSEACHALLMWAWTRTADQITFTDEATEAVFSAANEMGKLYTEDPPLIQAANVRIKIARVATALAARTHSTDSSGERVLVHPAHVGAAVRLIHILYGMEAFGYRERSRERLADRYTAEQNRDAIGQYLRARPQLARYLRQVSKFRRQDLDEVLGVSREESTGIISHLYEARMIRKVLGDIVVEPTLHSLLREVKL